MALLNRPLTEDEARQMLADWRNTPAGALRSSFWGLLDDMLCNPTPHVVHYRAASQQVRYVSPLEFPLFRRGPSSPSDCEWHVPGTEKRDFDE